MRRHPIGRIIGSLRTTTHLPLAARCSPSYLLRSGLKGDPTRMARLLSAARQRQLMLLGGMALGAVCLWAGCSHPEPTPPVAQAQSEYVGSKACAECHAEIFEKQSKSHHALTLRPAGEEVDGQVSISNVRLKRPQSSTEYGLERRNGELFQVRSENGQEASALRLDYLLGSGHHGITPMAKTATGWHYLVLTYFAGRGWDFSPMHGLSEASAQSGNKDGWPVMTEEIAKCWGCHSTHLDYAGSEIAPERSELGVRCESCHGPGRGHVARVRGGTGDLAIQNPRKWSSENFMALCQQCHNETATVEGTLMGIPDNPADPGIVKYQVHGLEQSRCYEGSAGKMRCTTCHDPHGDTVTEPAYYEAKCLSCHAGAAKKQTACPVNPRTGCLPCHMPKVQVEKHTQFADHWIRARSPFAPKSKRASTGGINALSLSAVKFPLR